MNFILTENAKLVCKHELGTVGIVPSQDFVTINKNKILVEPDTVGKPVAGCPNVGASIKPCMLTLTVSQGYSDLIRINGRRVCLASLKGITDGTPPGGVEYLVRNPGQTLAGVT
ncbi:hypothetical protein [Desulfobacter curvatus]|uniref:hypothetical protein n=1 Tax=Desulfobacter curvatus TaxID=2290 RepID=UPI00037CBBC6|nr:hypothetical protein [Desulfobacter curvatus]